MTIEHNPVQTRLVKVMVDVGGTYYNVGTGVVDAETLHYDDADGEHITTILQDDIFEDDYRSGYVVDHDNQDRFFDVVGWTEAN